MSVLNNMSLHDAAGYYEMVGLYVHPLKSQDKIPIIGKWTDISRHFTDEELKEYFATGKPKNIGLICGQKSDCTIIDRDFIVKGLWEGLEASQWVRQQRTGNRDHLFFRYCDELKAKKYHALGFEILNNGNNCVLTPSIHPTGNKYQFTQGEPENRPQMSRELIDRIKETITAFEALQKTVNKCRPVFRKFFKAYFTDNQKSNPHFRDMSVFHGASGREINLYLFAELKANGASFDEMDLLCKLIFLDDYDSLKCEYEISKIAAKATAKTETIKAHPVLSQFFDEKEDNRQAVSKGKDGKPAARDESVKKSCLYAEKEEVPDHIKDRAREIAETGNPLTFILSTHQTMHIGDIGIATSLLLSATCQHVLNTDGIQPKLSGASGKGKSDCAKGMAHLIPPEWIIIASLSDKAIYYMADEMKPGTIIFCDDVNLSEDLEKIINRATTFYQTGTTHISVDTNRKKHVLRIPARLGWWLTSIDDDQSLQTLNRTFGGEVDESKEQDTAVMRMQILKAALGTVGLPMNDDVITCREIIRDIKENNYIVKIPYAGAIQWRDVSNRRNLPMFLDLIKSFAVLRHRQREIDEEGHLIADLQDFIDAKQLYKSREQAQGTKLTASERNLCDALRRNGGEMTYQQLAIALKVGEDRITQILNGKGKGHDSGLKYKITGLHVERRTEKNTKGGYTTKNYVIMTAGYDPLAGYEEVVSLDDTNLPSYSKLTPNLPLETRNGRQELTILTNIQSVESNSKSITISVDNKGEEITELEMSETLPDSPHTQNEGKKGKFPAPDSENEKVSSGKFVVRNGQPIAETPKGKFPPKRVSSGNSRIDITHAHDWLRTWEKIYKEKLNSQNYQRAVTEYAMKFKADVQEVTYITCKYAGIDEVFT